ncbi:MAG: ATP-binding protein [Bacteroidetes bacterium]|nr:ATP-binding protein [Bacteroidota bacterium]
MRSLILLRGLPGSGKSTLAKELSENGTYPVFSVDDYFTDNEGNYRFQFDKNHLAYKQCQDNTRKAMSAEVSKIFIDNVFSLEWEMEPYFKLAGEFHYRIFVLTVENRHKGKNIHDVSAEQLEKMAEKYKVVLF